MELGGCEMKKEQLAKELMVKWFLENKRTDVKEVLQVIISSVYEEIETKKANN
ncbi:hypothetical protein COK81_31465 [Bacillus thuringiensis]|uniref:Uncharacterized protein n=2 Tax=Bacillus thuringiensis TaxID=1428 RepID=A0A9X7ATX7_BACTU|nr:hypothetical protein COM85_30580 [Bacillus thuringiensis]PFE25923.1 hypothetical protein CN312_32965 [Bacillus thuringiensis]PFT73544.1 hypothetical protein COK81_31465 [Bacillus thuringiensis]PFU07807.1 hypothetical protein COK78_06350 [Bacillus thuringiensis]PGO13388.1 hypothetical protein CN979_33285 [Bacillus thuringiensis]